MTDAKVVRSKLRKLLGSEDMEVATQRSITRKLEAQLGVVLDMHKGLIKEEIEAFLLAQAESEGADEEQQTLPQEQQQPAKKKQRTSEGGATAAAPAAAAGGGKAPPGAAFSVQLSPKRFVTLSTYKGKTYVDVREYYEKDGALAPGAKGLSMGRELWAALVAGAPALTQGLQDKDESVVVELGSSRRASVSSYGGRFIVSLREYYERDGQMLPGKKGISLAPEQWAALAAALDEITAALKAKGGAPLPPPGASSKPAAGAAAADVGKAGASPRAAGESAAGSSPTAAAAAAAAVGDQAGSVDLGGSKRAVADVYKGKAYLSIREYYEKDGQMLPGKKGISLTPEQFAALRQAAGQLSQAVQQNDTSADVALSNTRRAQVRAYKGKQYVDVREYYERDGQMLPGKKGISLAPEQWGVLQGNLEPLAAALAALGS